MTDAQAGLPSGLTMAWSRPVGWILDHLVYRTTVTGRNNVPTGGPVIFAANHISFLDGPVMFGASPRPMHILVKQEMFKGFLGRVLTASGQLPVDRQGDRAALQRCKDVLDAGRCVGILPEGTRGSGAAADINGGVAWLALNSGAPVVPVAILGRGRAMSTWTSFRGRGGASTSASGQPLPWPAGPVKAGVLQWTGRRRTSVQRWQGTSRTPSNSPGSPCPSLTTTT